MALFHIHTFIVYAQAVVFPNPSPSSCPSVLYVHSSAFLSHSIRWFYVRFRPLPTATQKETTDTYRLWYNDYYTTFLFSTSVLLTLFFYLRSSSHLPSWDYSIVFISFLHSSLLSNEHHTSTGLLPRLQSPLEYEKEANTICISHGVVSQTWKKRRIESAQTPIYYTTHPLVFSLSFDPRSYMKKEVSTF